MRKSFGKIVPIFRRISIGFLMVIGVPIYAYAFMLDRSPEPSSVPIKLSDIGVVADFRFEVRKHFSYWYSISFYFPDNDQVERTRVRKILGGHVVDKTGQPLEPGTPTPINLTILALCKDGKEVEIYSLDVDPILTSWGTSNFTKKIGNQVLAPGVYRARLANKRASPEFSSIPITFEIGMPAKVDFDPSKAPTGSKPCQQ